MLTSIHYVSMPCLVCRFFFQTKLGVKNQFVYQPNQSVKLCGWDFNHYLFLVKIVNLCNQITCLPCKACDVHVNPIMCL